jgi:aldehyde:ferredoxin oxidoreductase
MLDTCVSNTSTIEAMPGESIITQLGYPALIGKFSPWEVPLSNAKVNGWRQFEDSLGVCRFCTTDCALTLKCLNAITGWNLDLGEALTIGRRIVNQLRVFNFRHGLKAELERPSVRYGSTPTDGPVQGRGIGSHFEFMIRSYYEMMGWDPQTGRPLPHTLKSLGLGDLIEQF